MSRSLSRGQIVRENAFIIGYSDMGIDRIDIRDWSPDHSKMGKGITLSTEEIEKLKELL